MKMVRQSLCRSNSETVFRRIDSWNALRDEFNIYSFMCLFVEAGAKWGA